MDEINDIKIRMENGSMNPRDAKVKLAKEIITIFYNIEEAEKAEERFKLVFSQRDIPQDIPEVQTDSDEIWLPKFLLENGMVQSTSDGKRMIRQDAIKVNGQKIEDENLTIRDGMVIQVGKRKFIKIIKI